ncbi:MAG: ATP-binding protein, partial [Acidimicrobiales bacterium]
AVKFTRKGGIRLSVAHLADPTPRLRFAVSDTGPGILAEAAERLFERFSQLDGSTSRQHGGTGLGLAIARWVVELHGGSIAVVAPETPALIPGAVSLVAEGVSPGSGTALPDPGARPEGCRIRVTLPA